MRLTRFRTLPALSALAITVTVAAAEIWLAAAPIALPKGDITDSAVVLKRVSTYYDECVRRLWGGLVLLIVGASATAFAAWVNEPRRRAALTCAGVLLAFAVIAWLVVAAEAYEAADAWDRRNRPGGM